MLAQMLPAYFHTPSMLGVSSTFTTPNTESIRVLANKNEENWEYEQYLTPNTPNTGKMLGTEPRVQTVPAVANHL